MKPTWYPKPASGESAASYIRNIARGNGYASVELYKRVVFGDSRVVPMTLSAADIARAIGKNVEYIANLKLLTINGRTQSHALGTIEVPRHQLCRVERYCPDCVRENPICLSKWQIGWLPLCTKHKRPLLPMSREIERALFTEAFIPKIASAKELGLLLDLGELCDIQDSLECRLLAESINGFTKSSSIIEEVDSVLIPSLRLNSPECLRTRKKRYPVEFYSRNVSDSIKLLEHWSLEKAA